jgi:hypothetical protein
MKCPAAPRFRELVNMTPSEIRAWSKDPRSREYSLPETRARLPALAALRRDGCTRGYAVSLRNWGHAPRRCKV